ncbi:MAG: septum formation initiator family protein [Candidatus Dojkabacteria bacterium]
MDRFVYREKSKREKRNSVSSVSSFFNNFLAKMILLAISLFLFYNVGHSVNITVQRLDILKRAQVEVDSLRLKNLELDLLLGSMQSKEYLEVQARDRLNFAGEREYIFVIPENLFEEKEKELNKILYREDKEEERKIYEIWEDFFLKGV